MLFILTGAPWTCQRTQTGTAFVAKHVPERSHNENYHNMEHEALVKFTQETCCLHTFSALDVSTGSWSFSTREPSIHGIAKQTGFMVSYYPVNYARQNVCRFVGAELGCVSFISCVSDTLPRCASLILRSVSLLLQRLDFFTLRNLLRSTQLLQRSLWKLQSA
jgi:hypothetical protein